MSMILCENCVFAVVDERGSKFCSRHPPVPLSVFMPPDNYHLIISVLPPIDKITGCGDGEAKPVIE